MRLDHGPADGETQAEAARFGGEEGLEYLLDILGVQPRPGIAHRHLRHPAGGTRTYAHRDGATRGPGIVHRLDAVLNQVDDDLLDLQLISPDLGQVGRQLEDSLEWRGAVFPDDGNCLGDRRVDVERRKFDFRLVEEGNELMQARPGPVNLLDVPFEYGRQFFDGRLMGTRHFQCHFTVG